MNLLIIFGAKYLYLVIALVSLGYIWLQPREIRWKFFWCAIMALPLTYIVAKISSMFYYDARPFVVDHFTPLLSHADDNGFPSDHTLLSSALAVSIFFFHRTLGLFLLMLSLVVGMARVFAGIHHTVDIVGSMVIAGGVTYIVFTVMFPKVWSLFSKKYLKSL